MEKKKVMLISDFEDFYDDFFDKEGIPFERLRANELNRKQIPKRLAKHSLIPTLVGRVGKFRKKLLWDAPVIVYTDVDRHDGGEKLKMTYKEAYNNYKNNYMSLFIENKEEEAVLYRYIRVGESVFFFKLKGHSWNSNDGFEVLDCERVREEDDLDMKPFDSPILLIDFIPTLDEKGDQWLFAIDLNFSPTLKGSGIEKLATGEEIVELIKDWILKKIPRKEG